MLPKLLLYVTNDHLCAYEWRRRRLSAPARFAADSEGIDAFGRYLDSQPALPTYLVADLIEEDFQRQLLPHVSGRARRELIGRRLQHLYRDTPYRQVAFQGRELEGRRDDQVLFSALTNAAAVAPWAQALEARRRPLAAIYSAAFLSALLVRRLAPVQEDLLLITHQSGGLRQSYFQGRDLKFSRLTENVPEAGLAAQTAAETLRMQQFLTSTRLLTRGDLLQVVVVANADEIPALEAACADASDLHFHFIDMATAAQRYRLPEVPRLGDQLLLTLVGRRPPGSHFALGAAGRFYQLWQARLTLFSASAALALGAALWVATDIWDIAQDGRNAERLLKEAAEYDVRYRTFMASMPPAATKTANMKAAVLFERLLRAQAPNPLPLLGQLSATLERSSAINLDTLDWSVPQPAAPADGPRPITATAVGIPRSPPQTLAIEGDVANPQGSYRSIFQSMNQFVLDLRRQPRMAVDVAESPVDIRPTVKLVGKAGATEPQPRPKYALVLRWQP